MTIAILSTKIVKLTTKYQVLVCSLVTDTVLNINIGEVENETLDHGKYITTPELNKLTAGNFAARLKQLI